MFEIGRRRAEAGRKGAMRAFPASHSQSDSDFNLSDKVAMEAEEQDLGAAAPSERGNDKYLEEQKKKREKAKAKTKDREEKRKRSDDKVAQEISEETEEEIDITKWKTIEEMSPEDFHKVWQQQDKDIKELKRDKSRQQETNAAFSKVITPQSAAQKKTEETAVLYNCELTGIPRDDAEQNKREFVMWCTEEAGIPKHEVSSVEYVDMGRIYGVQTAAIKFGNKGNRTKMSKWMVQFKAWNPLKYYSTDQTWDRYNITGRYQETADQRERRDYLNVAWQIFKELEGEERIKSEEGAYLNYLKASINDKADHLPLV